MINRWLFSLNPPYKNTDENQIVRADKEANYTIDESILQLTGEDAGKERYLAFLGQILNICKEQVRLYPQVQPIVMIFTPTSWLIPRQNFKEFRYYWDEHFMFHNGFLITSNEFFSLKGTWPLAFTMWAYNYNISYQNSVQLFDLTDLKKYQLNKVNWNLNDAELNFQLNDLLQNLKVIEYNNLKGSIKDSVKQKQYAFKRDPSKTEISSNQIFGGLPLKDDKRINKKTYGTTNSLFVGFMDDNTPVRVNQDTTTRLSNKPDRVWLQLRPTFIDTNLTKIQSGPQDKYGYCAYNLESAKLTCSWFAITKAVNAKYPRWVNQKDIWLPTIKPELADYWDALCFAFVLAENRCVVTKFERDNPVAGAPEVYVDNPLCPTNKESFWNTTLAPALESLDKNSIARLLAEAITELYKYWNTNYCKGAILENVGLHNEPYFKYFSYPDFLTPYSGLIQIRKYAEQEGLHDILSRFEAISELTKKVKEELYTLLVVEFKYFE